MGNQTTGKKKSRFCDTRAFGEEKGIKQRKLTVQISSFLAEIEAVRRFCDSLPVPPLKTRKIGVFDKFDDFGRRWFLCKERICEEKAGKETKKWDRCRGTQRRNYRFDETIRRSTNMEATAEEDRSRQGLILESLQDKNLGKRILWLRRACFYHYRSMTLADFYSMHNAK